MVETSDIVISGAGPAGMIAALACGSLGYTVALVDPMRPVTSSDAKGADLRSTAFLQPARGLFEDIGIWPAMERIAVPLEKLRIVDTQGSPPEVREERLFQSDDAREGPLAWNFMNWKLREILLRAISDRPEITVYFGRSVSSIIQRTSSALVRLDDGASFRCKLLIAADGRNSPVREAVGISAKTTRYGQKSLAFVATHDRPHDNISTEIYHEGGPFTMVPLADHDGKAASAIVWMNPGRKALDLFETPANEFNAAMTERSAELFGEMRLIGQRSIFPIITQLADQVTSERVAIIAEAAHVLPPIGAQGLNTSLNDIRGLCTALAQNTGDPGSPEGLQNYERSRGRDLGLRSKAIDLFNRVTRSGLPPLQTLRLSGLKAAHDIEPLRKTLIRAGMRPL